MNTGLEELAWLFAIAVTVHMAEEVIWLPAWSQNSGKWHEPVSRRAFVFATAVMLLFLYPVTFLASTAPAESLSIYLLCGLALAMIVNLFVPHLGATITRRRYSPGLVTSLLLVTPLSAALLWQAFAQALVSTPGYWLAAGGMLFVAAVIWPALLRAGGRFPG